MNEQEIEQAVAKAMKATHEAEVAGFAALVWRFLDVCKALDLDPAKALKDYSDAVEKMMKK